ncbi:efflux RND transporter permease subunit [Romeriopsis navalis]|nr:efflux RND transporter permease subunit [Romeriopsis navalis]
MTLLYRNFRLLILCILLICVWGFASFQSLPRLEDPELTPRAAVIRTVFPGASADRVEALVSEPLEAAIAEVEEVENYASTSQAGISIVTVELQEAVTRAQVDNVWSRVRDKLRDTQTILPTGVTDPDLDQIEVRAAALLVGLTWEQNSPPNYAILRRRAEALEDLLRALPGTELIDTYGDPKEEIAVEMQPEALAALGLTAQDIAQQIRQSDVKGAAGQLRGNQEFLLEVAGELDSLERIRQIPIRCDRCNNTSNTGQFTRLGDIANIKKGIVEPQSTITIANGKPAIMLGVYVESGYRLDTWNTAAKAKLSEFQNQLPTGLGIETILEQNKYVEDRLNKLFSSLLIGSGLLFGVTIFMMGLQSALIIQLTLPLSVLMVFGLMTLMKIPLHQMSIMGLIVALGLLIDNAIIVVDDVQNRLRQGLRGAAAVKESVQYLRAPLIAGTLTTVLAFMPIALLTGNIGEFIGTLGLNVVLSVLASLAVALTITPVLTVRLRQFWKRSSQGFSNRQLKRIYQRSLSWTFARPILGIFLSLLLPLSGFFAVTTLDLQFFPAADRDQMQIEVELPASTSLAQTQIVAQQVRDKLLTHNEITNIHWFIGESSPRVYYNQIGNRSSESSYANGIIQLKHLVTNDWLQQVQTEVDQAFPAARVLLRTFEQGPPFSAPIELRIYGPDLEILETLGEQTRAILTQLPAVTHSRSRLSDSLAQLTVNVDETQARSRGLSRQAIAQQLDTTLEGIQGGSVLEGTEELPVRVRLAANDRASLDRIASLDLLTPGNGSTINSTPLNALGELALEPKRSAITRRNGRRVNTVQGYLAAGTLPDNALQEFQKRLDQEIQLPAGYELSFGGEVEERNAAVGNLLARVGILVIMMVATLVLSLGSFRFAALIGAVAVVSVGLGFLAEWVWGYPLGFNPLIGTIGLIGVAVNDSITVLTALKEDPTTQTGNPQAIRRVVMHSTRHVLTTTMTTVLGFAPLIWGGGAFWPPLAVAIAGGVTGATLLALYFVPAAYLLMTRHKQSKPTSRALPQPTATNLAN